MALQPYIEKAVSFGNLTAKQMQHAMEEILSGSATETEIAAFAVALRMKGETAEELSAAAKTMKRFCSTLKLEASTILDTCGTGGDQSGTFNISTITAIAVAACGVTIAKHGNRAVSSKSGSADVLEALGIRIDLDPPKAKQCIEELGIGFLFAPKFHQAMRHAGSARKALGIRTFFNLLGPLTNPAAATHQILGVYGPEKTELMAQVLGSLGVKKAWVVWGEGGLDEISPTGKTKISSVEKGQIENFEIHPNDFGIEPISLDQIQGGDVDTNAQIARDILDGKQTGTHIPILLNGGAALFVTGRVSNLKKGAEKIEEVLKNGQAKRLLEKWAIRSHSL